MLNAACSDDVETVVLAARVVANMALSEDGRAQLVEDDAISLLVALCKAKEEPVQANATAAVANLAEDRDMEIELLEKGAVESLAGNTSSMHDGLVFHSARGLLPLTAPPENRHFVIDKVGLGPFVSLCQHQDMRIKKMGAECMGNLGVKVELAYEAEDSGSD